MDSSSELDVFEFRSTSESEISDVEAALSVHFPKKYKEFMKRYGGGMFLFVDLLPVVDSEEGDDLLKVNRGEFRGTGFVAVSPVGSGDWWGFSVTDGVCAENVDFWDHEDGRIQFASTDFLDFLAKEGLRADAG
ncbi:hypothetical protein AMK09_17155 [Streptomyces sp. CB02488]|nr:hypothetical protein AMK09_17155 [Streptomyces sp. CB02488]